MVCYTHKFSPKRGSRRTKRISIEKWDGRTDRSQVLRVAFDFYRSSNIDPFEKPFREVSRHPHAAVGGGIPRKITGMHANCLAEFHVVRHWRGLIMGTRWYVGAGSCIRICHPARTIDNFSEALRMMVDILPNNREIARWCRPTRLT